MIRALLFSASLVAGNAFAHCSAIDNFFNKADVFLRGNVSNGLVDYNGIKADPAELNELVAIMKEASLGGQSASTRKAFWINAYNITMIRSVVSNMPLNSPLDVPGLFDTEKHSVAGQQLTLSDIENKKLLDVFGDARIHFVLVCGAMGCPTLKRGAYKPTLLESQILAQTRLAMNSGVFTRVDNTAKRVRISKIFEWYKDDFTSDGRTFLEYINKYRNIQIPSDYAVSFYTYDWSLNIKR